MGRLLTLLGTRAAADGPGGGLAVVASEGRKSVFGFTVPVPAGTVDGDFMLAFVARRATSDLPNLATQGWTLIGSSLVGDTRSFAYSRVASSEPATYSIASGGHTGVAIVTVRPSLTPNIADFDVVSATNKAAPSVDATAAGDLLVCFWADASSTAYAITAPEGMTQLEATGDSNVQFCLAYEVLATPGATGTRTAAGSTLGDDDYWSVVVTEA